MPLQVTVDKIQNIDEKTLSKRLTTLDERYPKRLFDEPAKKEAERNVDNLVNITKEFSAQVNDRDEVYAFLGARKTGTRNILTYDHPERAQLLHEIGWKIMRLKSQVLEFLKGRLAIATSEQAKSPVQQKWAQELIRNVNAISIEQNILARIQVWKNIDFLGKP